MAAASKEEIRGWLEKGKAKKATHVIIVCDTWDHDDYPSFVLPGENVVDKLQSYEGSKDLRVMEVYKLSMDVEAQLRERRAHNI